MCVLRVFRLPFGPRSHRRLSVDPEEEALSRDFFFFFEKSIAQASPLIFKSDVVLLILGLNSLRVQITHVSRMEGF